MNSLFIKNYFPHRIFPKQVSFELFLVGVIILLLFDDFIGKKIIVKIID